MPGEWYSNAFDVEGANLGSELAAICRFGVGARTSGAEIFVPFFVELVLMGTVGMPAVTDTSETGGVQAPFAPSAL